MQCPAAVRLVDKTYMTRVEGENTRRHYLKIAPQNFVLL